MNACRATIILYIQWSWWVHSSRALQLMLRTAQRAYSVSWDAIFFIILVNLNIWSVHYPAVSSWLLCIISKMSSSMSLSNCCSRLGGHMLLNLSFSSAGFAWTFSFYLSVVWMRKHWVIVSLLIIWSVRLCLLFLTVILAGHLSIFLLFLLKFDIITVSKRLNFGAMIFGITLELHRWRFHVFEFFSLILRIERSEIWWDVTMKRR